MSSKRLRVIPAALVLAALSGSVFAAAPVIFSNTSNLLPNTAGQTVQLFISGSDQIVGEDLNVEINGGTTGPTITGANILGGTIFSPNNEGQIQIGIVNSGTLSGHAAFLSTTTNPGGTVIDNGLLLTLTLNTTALASGTFSLNLINTANGASDLVLPNATTIDLSQSYSHIQFSIGSVDRQWLVNGSGVWNSDPNWTPFAPYAAGDAADFAGALTTATTATVTVDGPRVVGALNFNNAIGNYALIPQGATVGSLELNNVASAPMINDSAGSHTIAAPITLDASTNVTVVRPGDVMTLSGAISGAAANLIVGGAGKVILSGNNSYAATSIASGATVQVGAGTTTGSLGAGAVTDNGTLAFNRSDAPVVSNGIAGLGGLTNAGPGTVSLTGVVNLSGGANALSGLMDFGGGVTHNVGAVTIGAGGVTIDAGTTLVSGAVNALSTGPWTIAGKQQIHPGLLTVGTSVVSALPTFVGTGQLDISDNKFIAQSTGATGNKTSLISSIRTLVSQGSNGGSWNGPGITSSTVANDVATGTAHSYHTTVAIVDNGALATPFGTYGGQPVTPNSILVTRALVGDGDLNNTINNADLVVLFNHFGATGATQSSGDYDGNGTVNNADLVALFNDFGQSLPGGFSVLPAGGGNAGSTSGVPEPASLAMLAMGGAAMLVRRRKPNHA